MSIFDIFAPKQEPQQQQQQQPAATPTQTTPGNIPNQTVDPTKSSPTTAGNGVIPGGESGKPESPLEGYKDLWETTINPNEDPNGKSPAAANELTAEQLQKVVQDANFAEALTPEMFAKINEGGEEAQQVFTQALNQVARNVMVQATLVGNKLADKRVKEAIAATESKLPELLRGQQVTAENPLFKDPAIKPVMEATKMQLMNKFPDASPQEIADMAKKYIIAMGKAFNPDPTPAAKPGEEDWSSFLETPTA